MYCLLKKLLFTIIVIVIFAQGSFSQHNKTKIKASVSVIPGIMYSGESYEFKVKIKNISERVWYPDYLHLSFSGPFGVEISSKPVILKPKESTEIICRLKAPNISDVYFFGLVVYNNGEETASSSVIIDVQNSPWTITN